MQLLVFKRHSQGSGGWGNFLQTYEYAFNLYTRSYEKINMFPSQAVNLLQSVLITVCELQVGPYGMTKCVSFSWTVKRVTPQIIWMKSIWKDLEETSKIFLKGKKELEFVKFFGFLSTPFTSSINKCISLQFKKLGRQDNNETTGKSCERRSWFLSYDRRTLNNKVWLFINNKAVRSHSEFCCRHHLCELLTAQFD